MKFAFLVHPLSEATSALLHIGGDGAVGKVWSSCGNLLEFCDLLSQSMENRDAPAVPEPQVRVIDHLKGLASPASAECEGRLYEIPMNVTEILDDPAKALVYMEQAVDAAAEWGADLVGLGSMTGIVGGQGQMLAERGPVAVTTGNSLTAYAAIQTLENACRETDRDLADEVIAVVGIPGSIATVVAKLLAPRCRGLILVARRDSSRARKLQKQLDAELVLDIPTALSKASIILSATSTGGCIQQQDLRSGSVVIDVGVPADVDGSRVERDDVLVLSGGLALTPSTMPRDSMWLGFHHGMVPCCLGETMVLALEKRAECYTIGRNLSPEAVLDIGSCAQKHGFDFSPLISFGLPVTDTMLSNFKKAVYRATRTNVTSPLDKGSSNGSGMHNESSTSGQTGNGQISDTQDTCCDLTSADRAEVLFGRHINPVMLALSGNSGFVRTLVRGEDCYVWDREGNRYLDFVAGFGSMNVGHNHPRVSAAIQDAIASQAVGYAQSAINPYAAALAERLVTLSPAGLEMAFFTNSGTESVEAALKLARLATGQTQFLYCHRSYHGKSLGSLSVTGNPNYQKPFRPLLSGCDPIEYGDLEALERRLQDNQYAAFIVEPLQGEGGMIVPPTGFLRHAADLCREYGVLLIVDEVQTGLGRTGELFACDRESVAPDIMTLAKSLGGGMMPIGAMLSRRDLWNKAYGNVKNFSLHTSTFGGGSLACAAALATLDVLVDEDLAVNARERGQQLRRELRKLQKEIGSAIVDVRGEGLMTGIEFAPLRESIASHWRQSDTTGMMQYTVPDLDRHIAEIPAMYVMQSLLKRSGIYTQVARSRGNVLRVQPPLTVSEEHITEFVAAVRTACLDLHATSSLVDSIISKSITGIHEGSSAKPAETSGLSESLAPVASANPFEPLPPNLPTNGNGNTERGASLRRPR